MAWIVLGISFILFALPVIIIVALILLGCFTGITKIIGTKVRNFIYGSETRIAIFRKISTIFGLVLGLGIILFCIITRLKNAFHYYFYL